MADALMSEHAHSVADDQAHPEELHSHHVATAATFVNTLLALLVLTTLTVVVSRFDFGSFNMLIAMGIAAVKAALVMTFFMHLKWDTATNNIVFLSSFAFLSLLFVFTLADFATRGGTNPLHRLRAPIPDVEVPLMTEQGH